MKCMPVKSRAPLGRWRRLSKRGWPVHALLIAGLLLLPCPHSFADWITIYENDQPVYRFDDANLNGIQDESEEVEYAPFAVTLYNGDDQPIGEFYDTTRNLMWDADESGYYFNSDDDTLLDWEEYEIGTAVSSPDTDWDGIRDDDEWLLAKPVIASLPEGNAYDLSLLQWDSNDDGVSDYDAYFLATHPGSTFQAPIYSGGQLPNFPNARYYDFDGDGFNNPEDPYPQDPLNNDSDGDGLLDWDFSVSPPVPNDPVANSVENPSPWNGWSWIRETTTDPFWGVLADYDGDGVKNWYDLYPDQGLSGDSDGDLILDFIDGVQNDPVLDNPENPQMHTAPEGLIHWRRDALEDADGDSIANWHDSHPYDEWNGTGDDNSDGDAFVNRLDPAPQDGTNTSGVNGYAWEGAALEDSDGDATANFFDPYPYDPYDGVPDFDGDGFLNESDPYPTDVSNTSTVNGAAWGSAVWDDNDGDGNANWCDTHPEDEFDGDPNVDGDDFPNGDDPAPRDSSNHSETNGITWWGDACGDNDGDGTFNFDDPSPYPANTVDSDGDGFMADIDPNDGDSSNYSETNWITWYSEALGDHDGDGAPNWSDTYPYDEYDGQPDIDSDGIPNEADPCPRDYNNFSSLNGQTWPATSALDNNDGDYMLNWWDPEPSMPNDHPDRDFDGILNATDPFPDDSTNFSPANSQAWFANVFGDEDGDGNPNHSDSYPWDAHDAMDAIDGDEDGLSLWWENEYGTSDGDVDSDDDGLTDYEELVTYGTDPTDKFSISQALGWGDLYDDPVLVDMSDSDGDGIPNLVEAHYIGLDPQNPDDGEGDLDANGLTNRQQYDRGMSLNADLVNYDADLDGMSNLWEDYYGFNRHDPLDATGDLDGDHVLNWEEQVLRLDPTSSNSPGTSGYGDKQTWLDYVVPVDLRWPIEDADVNGIPDWIDSIWGSPSYSPVSSSDWDDDGLPNWWEHKYGTRNFPNGLNLRQADADGDNEVNGGDGLTNLQEFQVGTHPLIADTDGNGVNDSDEDWDSDGLTTLQELAHGTNTLSWDSDGDGISDAQELAEGSDPLVSSSNSAAAVGLRVFTPLPPLPGNAF